MPTVNLPPFWSLVDAHGGELLAHARHLVGPADAEDVLQDALLKALRAYPKLRHAEHLRAWMYRVTTTAAYDHLARVSRRRRNELADDEPLAAVPAPDGDPSLFDDAFAELVADLPELAREALQLRFVDDLDYAAMAERLGCSTEAARQRVSSAIRSLRQEFATT